MIGQIRNERINENLLRTFERDQNVRMNVNILDSYIYINIYFTLTVTMQ